MTMHQLSALRAVVESGSYAKAAEAQYTSASALLQQIRSLEKELGYQVLSKKKNGMSLTEAGNAFWKYAREALSLLQHGIDDGKSIADAESSRLRIGIVSRSAARSSFIMELAFSFHEQYPHINLEFVNCDYYNVANDIENGRYDVRFTQFVPAFDEKKLTMMRTFNTVYYCLMDENDPLSKKRHLSSRDLSGRTVYIHKYDDSDTIEEQLHTWSPEAAYELSEVNASVIYQCCMSKNLFILRSPRKITYPHIHAIPLDYECEGYNVIVAAHNPPPCAQLFLEFAREKSKANV